MSATTPPHAAWGFGGLLAGFIAFRWKSGKRAIAAISLTALVLIALATQSQSLTGDLHPRSSTTAFFDDIRYYTSASEQVGFEQGGRANIRASEPIRPRMLAKLRGHTVAVFPFDIDLAWAYNLKWDPIPVLQSYTAYTSGLDALDASFLQSSKAPQMILYGGPVTIDGRVGPFDQGQTYRAMLCHYRLIDTKGPLEVLARVTDRCPGASRQLAAVHAAWGQTVAVPKVGPGNWLEYVRIYGTAPAGLARLGGALFKPTERYVQINGGALEPFVTATATDGLPIKVPRRVDYGSTFDVGIDASTMSVTKGTGVQSTGTPLTYKFYAERIG